MRVRPANAGAVTTAMKCASSPLTVARAPGSAASMRRAISCAVMGAGPGPPTGMLIGARSRDQDRRQERVIEIAGDVGDAVGVGVDVERVADSAHLVVDQVDGPEALDPAGLVVLPGLHEPEAGVGLDAGQELVRL